MLAVAERFIRYAKIDTQSQDGVEAFPSTEKQKRLGELLVEEMKALGLSDVRMDAHGYVYGVIPSNLDGAEGHPVPSLGFIAHMDTAPPAQAREWTRRSLSSTTAV